MAGRLDQFACRRASDCTCLMWDIDRGRPAEIGDVVNWAEAPKRQATS